MHQRRQPKEDVSENWFGNLGSRDEHRFVTNMQKALDLELF